MKKFNSVLILSTILGALILGQINVYASNSEKVIVDFETKNFDMNNLELDMNNIRVLNIEDKEDYLIKQVNNKLNNTNVTEEVANSVIENINEGDFLLKTLELNLADYSEDDKEIVRDIYSALNNNYISFEDAKSMLERMS